MSLTSVSVSVTLGDDVRLEYAGLTKDGRACLVAYCASGAVYLFASRTALVALEDMTGVAYREMDEADDLAVGDAADGCDVGGAPVPLCEHGVDPALCYPCNEGGGSGKGA